MLEQRIEQDLKAALLAGESLKVSTLRGVKSAFLNVKVATGSRDSGLSEEEMLRILAKEAKQRQESADAYRAGNDEERAQKEIAEKAIIDAYLPQQLTEDEIATIVAKVIAEQDATGSAAMGQVISAVKAQTKATAEGSIIARITKEKLGL